MRGIDIVGTSIPFPPNQAPLHNRNKHKPFSLNPSKHSPSNLSCSSPPLLMNVRQDLTQRSGNRLKYYAALASRLAEDGRIEDFLMITESVLVLGIEPSQFVDSLNIKLVSAGVSGLVCDGKLESVIEALSRVEKLGICPSKLFDRSLVKLLALECRRLVNGGKLEEAVGLMEILAGYRFPVKEFVEPLEIIKMCVQKRDPDLAVRYTCILPHAHILFSSIIREFGKKRDLVSALISFELSKCNSNVANMHACRTIIDVCGLCGDFLKARYIYEELLAQKVAPNTYVFNSLMNVNAHDLSYTLHVYKHMQNLGVTADMASYNILLKACCLSGRVDFANDIYKEVQHKASARLLELDVITYSTIIKVFADAKMWQMALKIKEDMLSAGVTPNVVTWSSMISACGNAGLVEQAIQVFEEMLLAGCEPNSQCCNCLLNACVEACQYDRAFRIFQSWKESGFQKTCDTTEGNRNIRAELSSGNDITKLQSWNSDPHDFSFAKVVPFTPTTATYNILMKACGNDYYRAKVLMDEMKIAGLSPDHISWSILIDICGSSGNVGGSIQALKAMRDTGIKPDVVAYTTAIKACVENNSLKMAFSLFEEMKRYRLQPNLVTYNTLLRARSSYGSLHEVKQCLAIYQDMRRAGYNPNDYFLKELIEEWCEGVIKDDGQDQSILGLYNSRNKTEVEKPQGLLLEKVAAHLQKDVAETLSIDLRGLTKIEARIVVLATLRMIKESYIQENPLKDVLVIVLGIKKERAGAGANNHESDVHNAVVKLLQDELGLEVVLTGPRIPLIRNHFGSPLDSDINPVNLGENGLPVKFESLARRPAVLQTLKVTRKSLYHWLQKKIGR